LWHRVFRELGFKVVMTGFSDKKLYAKGQYTISSDTACYPAKLMHGHIEELVEKGVDAIFYPCLTYNINEKESNDNHYNCPVVAYYSEVLNGNMENLHKDVKFLFPYLTINNPKKLSEKLAESLKDFSVSVSDVRRAVDLGLADYEAHMKAVKEEGARALAFAREHGKDIIILCGRPYHVDSGICQGIDQLIESLGFVIVSEDCVADLVSPVGVNVINQWVYHSRLYNAAKYVAMNDDCQLVQLVSFGCGLDAITTDKVRSILEKNGKFYTQIKIDEISNLGAARIRLRSLMGAMAEKKANA
ncbi:MAG: 2-hydroxyacyl-CoA dehydratase, partial [Firmicutes bacterium]|nr:2-hydroxyacyl-CoA dehydratase [Bacillota bacterium]